MKRTISLFLAIFSLLLLCACGTKANVDPPNSEIAERDKAIEEAVKKRQEQIATQKAKSDVTPEPTPEPAIDNNYSVEGYYTGQEYIYVEGGYEYVIGKDNTDQLDIELQNNETCTLFYNHKMHSGTWTYSKDTVYVSVVGNVDAYGTLTNGVLYLHDCPKTGYDTIFFKDGVEIDEADVPHVYKPSYVERAFEESRDLMLNKCESTNGIYTYTSDIFYDKVIILDDDIAYFEGKPIMIGRGALYHSWTKLASAIYKGKVDYYTQLDTLSATIGIIPKESEDSMKNRFGAFLELMGQDMESEEVLSNLNARGIISNMTDSERALEYDILDLNGASETLGITQRMLGYALSYIGGAAEFDENSVHVTIYKLTND